MGSARPWTALHNRREIGTIIDPGPTALVIGGGPDLAPASARSWSFDPRPGYPHGGADWVHDQEYDRGSASERECECRARDGSHPRDSHLFVCL